MTPVFFLALLLAGLEGIFAEPAAGTLSPVRSRELCLAQEGGAAPSTGGSCALISLSSFVLGQASEGMNTGTFCPVAVLCHLLIPVKILCKIFSLFKKRKLKELHSVGDH